MNDLETYVRPGIKIIQVQRPTALKQLLKPGMGPVHWAACRLVKGIKPERVDEVAAGGE